MRRVARVVLAIALLGAITFGTAGCGEDQPVGVSMDEIRISGSGTTLPLMHLMTDAYTGRVDFTYLPGLHSGGGVEGAHQGDLELGAVSRGLEGDELDYGLELTVLSTDALVLAVHPSVDVSAITSAQVRDIYSGVITDWSELGGPAEPIIVLDRPEDESAKQVLREHVLGADFEVMEGAIPLYYEGDMVDAVETTPYSIGYFSMGYGVVTGAEARLVALDDVMPSVDTVAEGVYAMTRELGVVHGSAPDDHVSEFLEWATSEDAAALLAANGYAAVVGR